MRCTSPAPPLHLPCTSPAPPRTSPAPSAQVHTLKNPKGKSNLAAFEALERCQPRFGLSGTPMSNKYVELWSLFDFVSNHRVGSKKDFSSFYVNSLQAVGGRARARARARARDRVGRHPLSLT